MFIGMGMVVFGVVAGAAYAVSQVPGFLDRVDDLERVQTDEPRRLTVAEDVQWTVFIEPSTASLAGTQIVVTSVATGERIPLESGGNFSYDLGTRSGRSFADVFLPAGSYDVEVTGRADFALGPDPTAGFRRWVFTIAIIMLPFILGGLIISIVSAVRDTRSRTEAAEPPAPSPWSAGEWPADPGR